MTSAGSTVPQALQALANETASSFTFESLGGSRFLSFAQLAEQQDPRLVLGLRATVSFLGEGARSSQQE